MAKENNWPWPKLYKQLHYIIGADPDKENLLLQAFNSMEYPAGEVFDLGDPEQAYQ
jgi:hypothetical protein